MSPAIRVTPVGGRRDRIWLHVVLLVVTFASATYVGTWHYVGFLSDFGTRRVGVTLASWLAGGLWYSVTVLFILGAHELGHYFACRYYRIDASLPYFIPAPMLLTGTLGAFIRIRQPIASKRQLFDIGIAGPIAGFVVAVPALVIGLGLSHVARLPPKLEGLELGEPLLYQFVSQMLWGTVPDGYSPNLHPMAFAAWFGLMATFLNLLPLLQLDGGHIAYAVFGSKTRFITLGSLGVLLILTVMSPWSWMAWVVLLTVMLLVFGPKHPPTLDEDIPLDSARRWLAVAALAIFVLCFTPAPIQPLDLIRR